MDEMINLIGKVFIGVLATHATLSVIRQLSTNHGSKPCEFHGISGLDIEKALKLSVIAKTGDLFAFIAAFDTFHIKASMATRDAIYDILSRE